jgi:hypothetical protein
MPTILSLPLYGVYNGGLNTRDDPRALPLNKSPYLRNVELRRNRVEPTPGYTPHSGTDSDTASIQGMFVARYNGNTYLLKADGGKIKKLKVVGSSPDTAWGTLKTGMSTTAQVEFAQANNVVYLVNGVGTAQKWDLATVPANTSDAAGIPLAKTIAYFAQRLVTSNGDRLDLSNVGAYETFASYKYADQGEGGSINRVLDSGRSHLLILKDTGRYSWDGVDTSTSNPKRYSGRGTTAPRSAVMLPSGEVAFCDHEGVWIANVFDYGERLLSAEITPTWQTLNHAKLDLAAGAFFNDQLLISVADGGSTVNNLTFAFDFQLDEGRGGWLVHEFGTPVWASYVDSSGINQMAFGSTAADSKVFRRYQGNISSEFNYNSGAINSLYYTKEIDFREIAPTLASKVKAMIRKIVSTSREGNYSLTLGWRKDNDSGFNYTAWSLATDTENWSASATDTWPATASSSDVWGGTQKVEGVVPNFKITGRTTQSLIQMNAANQPFEYYGETLYFIPLKSLK